MHYGRVIVDGDNMLVPTGQATLEVLRPKKKWQPWPEVRGVFIEGYWYPDYVPTGEEMEMELVAEMEESYAQGES